MATVERAVSALGQIQGFIGSLSNRIWEIQSATDEQNPTSQEVAEQVKQSAHQTAQAASDLARIAEQLSSLMKPPFKI